LKKKDLWEKKIIWWWKIYRKFRKNKIFKNKNKGNIMALLLFDK
jgi:hypothetical protein